MSGLAEHVRHRGGRRDRGVIAIVTGILMVVFLGFSGLVLDVGHWYLVKEQTQKAADAAVLAGVVNLPGDPATAYATAAGFSGKNGFPASARTAVSSSVVPGKKGQLQTTVTTTVDNWFVSLFGKATTTIASTAVADFSRPVVMGSPCNEYGSDPDTTDLLLTNRRGVRCTGTGAFWGNVGSPTAPKSNGDAYQNGVCGSSGVDYGCTGSVNTDYDARGYFYAVTVTSAVQGLTIQAYDPAFVNVGDKCEKNSLPTTGTARYLAGALSPYCTGDNLFSGTVAPTTQFIVRKASSTSVVGDPSTYPPVCTTAPFTGFNESLATISTRAATDPLKQVFRQWVTLCPSFNASPGTYFVQVLTNGQGADSASGHNRFSLRAFGSSGSSLDAISVSGFEKMGIYANLPNANTTFHLARIPTTAAGHVLNIRLFDIGDSNVPGTVTVLTPSGLPPTTCLGSGVVSGTLVGCSFAVTTNGAFNGKWQQVSVTIPNGYSCNDSDPADCWFKLNYFYGAGSAPNDTTSWTASLDGDPVRLVQ